MALGIVAIHLLLCSAAAYLKGAFGLHLSAVADADHVTLRRAALGGASAELGVPHAERTAHVQRPRAGEAQAQQPDISLTVLAEEGIGDP